MRRSAMLLLAVALSPAAARAENALGLDSLRFARLQDRVESEDSVRVHTSLGRFVVPHPVFERDSVVTAADVPAPRVSLRDLRAIDGRGNHVWTGAVIGAGVSVGLGLTGLFVCDHCDHGFANVVGFTAGSAGAGGLTGALIGLPIGRWRTLYRSP